MQAHACAPMFLGVHAPLYTLLSDTKSIVKPYHAQIMPGHAQHKPGPFLSVSYQILHMRIWTLLELLHAVQRNMGDTD